MDVPNVSRWHGVAGGFLLAAALLAGCSSAGAPASGGTPGPDGTVQPKVNRVVWAIKTPATLETSNPRMVCCFDSFQFRPSHESLVAIEPTTGQFGPSLATAWKIDTSANTVTFTLREGVKFHEEKWGDFTSDDVVHTFQTLIAPSDPPSTITWIETFWKRVVKEVRATAPNEVVFSINPHVNFMLFMSDASHQMAIRSKKQQAAEPEPKTAEEKGPVGTGPYQWAEHKTGSHFRFTRVPYQHWKGQPDFPEFEFRFINEPSTRMAALLANEVHITDLPSDMTAQAERSGMKAIANRVPAPRVWGQFRCCYVDPQTKQWPMYPDTPLLNIKVREALNRAINREELGKAFAPKGSPMYLNHFHPTRQGWDSVYEQRFREKYGYDPARARQLLQEAGYGPGNPLQIDVMTAPLTYIAAGPDIAESIAQYWRAVGIEPNLVSMDGPTEVAQHRAYRFSNTFRLQSASATIIDGINIFSSGANPPGGGYWTPEFMEKLNELNATLDTEKQNQLLKWIGDFGFNQYWDVPLWYVPLEVVVNPKIVADYTFPGMVHGGWSHFESIKAAR